jgi:hypothetical protein
MRAIRSKLLGQNLGLLYISLPDVCPTVQRDHDKFREEVDTQMVGSFVAFQPAFSMVVLLLIIQFNFTIPYSFTSHNTIIAFQPSIY